MTVLRQYIILLAFALWQGGFFFYVSFVVSIGTDELGSAMEQGFITRRVTQKLNVLGAIVLVLFLCENRGWGRWSMWWCMVLMQVGLFYLHPRMESLLEIDVHHVIDRPRFYRMHRFYLWMSTFQWAFAMVWLFLTLRNWNRFRVSA